MNYRKVCYVFPKTRDFREDRPRLCYEHMYGQLDGYGILFDPVISTRFKEIPEFSNGSPASIEADTFYITSSGNSSIEFASESANGLFICPHSDQPGMLRFSKKERLQTSRGTFFYPYSLGFENTCGNDPTLMLGEKPALTRRGDHLELYFEFFAMAGYWISEYPHKRLSLAADILADILGFDVPETDVACAGDLRLDCQSYGIARLYMQWMLRLLGENENEIVDADVFYRSAAENFIRGNFDKVQDDLQRAFRYLEQIRKKYVSTDYRIAEFPHAGILFPENGFFELEWPEGSRQILSAHLLDAEVNNYRAGFELGASCWKELNELYPDMVGRFKKLWHEKKITLTNGTWGLPYSFVSPLALQYGQLACGHAQFKKIFGQAPAIYQCQENAFTPQMPELLKYFNYSGAIHTSQNHGRPPYEAVPEICWKSPAGIGLSALTCSEPGQIVKGINFFYDLPLQLSLHKDDSFFNAFSFMDLGFIPLREQMIRIAKYAPVFGRFVRPEELFSEKESFPEKTYSSDDYNFSSDAFYRNYTNCNAISQYENVFSLAYLWRISQMLSFESCENDPQLQLLCSLEAHDCDRVQGQRPGEFYFRRSNETGPYSRDTLCELLQTIRQRISDKQLAVYKQYQPQKTNQLFNSGEIPLPLARITCPEMYSGKSFKFGNQHYVTGNFAPFTCSPASEANTLFQTSSVEGRAGKWIIRAEKEKVLVQYGEKNIVFSIRDHLSGDFKLNRAEYGVSDSYLTAKLYFEQLENRTEFVLLEGITSSESDYIFWHLRYAAPGNFKDDARWEDYLALSFDFPEEGCVSNFVPNMLCRTEEKKICSSNCLHLENAGKRCFLLFSGIGNFCRTQDKLDWLFHVADETVFERDIVFSFGSQQPALLARELFTGLLPLDNSPENLPVLNDPEISVECRIAENKWLLSNVSDQFKNIVLPEGAEMFASDGSKLSPAVLAPWQLGVLQVK